MMDCRIALLLSDVEALFNLNVRQWDYVQRKETASTGLLNIVLKLETSRGPRCLKLYGRGNFNEQELLGTVEATEHILSHGYTWLSRFYAIQTGQYLVPCDDGMYTLSDWIQGTPVNMRDALHRKAAAYSLARFHKASEGYAPWMDIAFQYTHTDHRSWETWGREFTDTAALFERTYGRLTRTVDKQAWETQLVESFPSYLEEATAMSNSAHSLKQDYEAAINYSAAKRGFVHDDLGLGNIVVAHDSEAYLIDFEGCHQKPRWHDLHSLLIGLDILSFPKAQYAQDVLSVYHAHNSLIPEEAAIIPLLVSPMFHLRWFLHLAQEFRHTVSDEQLSKYYDQSAGKVAERIRFRKEVEATLCQMIA